MSLKIVAVLTGIFGNWLLIAKTKIEHCPQLPVKYVKTLHGLLHCFYCDCFYRVIDWTFCKIDLTKTLENTLELS